jgi:hypothetical protein
MTDKAIGHFCILIAVLGLVLFLGACAPEPSENDSNVSGNLKDIQFVHKTSEYVMVVVTFEDKQIHNFLMYGSKRYCFQLDRINVIHYNSMNHITKVEILE